MDTILNRTLISKTSNTKKLNRKPSAFMQTCLEQHGNSEQRLLNTLRSHFICEDGYLALLDDKFVAFTSARREQFRPAVQSLLSQGALHAATPI